MLWALFFICFVFLWYAVTALYTGCGVAPTDDASLPLFGLVFYIFLCYLVTALYTVCLLVCTVRARARRGVAGLALYSPLWNMNRVSWGGCCGGGGATVRNCLIVRTPGSRFASTSRIALSTMPTLAST